MLRLHFALFLAWLLAGATQSSGSPGVPDHVLTAWAVRSTTDGRICEEHNGHLALIPASTIKLPALHQALSVLGPHTRLTTRIHLDTSRMGRARVVVVGAADPSLGSPHLGADLRADSLLSTWSRIIAPQIPQGRTVCVEGDASLWGNTPPHAPTQSWEDLGNAFGARLSGLPWREGMAHVVLTGGATGARAQFVRTDPAPSALGPFLVDVVLDGTRDDAWIFGSPLGPRREIRGTYPAVDTVRLPASLPHPDWTLAAELAAALTARGRPATPCRRNPWDPREPLPARAPILMEVEGAPLTQITRRALLVSDNVLTGQLATEAARREGLQVGPWLSRVLTGAGAPSGEARPADAHGLSRTSLVSPRAMTFWASRLGPDEPFLELVPDGTHSSVRARVGLGWDRRLRAKTGSMSGVATLAGWFRADAGDWRAFHLVFSGHEGPPSTLRESARALLTGWASASCPAPVADSR